MGETDSYKITAEYYDDAYAHATNLVDLPFYLELARRIGGPVLEMGCGSGRVLMPTARAGIEIHGLDSSAAMLGVLRNHIQGEPAEVQRRIVIHEGDMRRFRGRQKYPLVTIPFRPMQHMYTVEDQVAALRTAVFHLADDGILAFDVFFPNFALFSQIGKEDLEMEWPVESHPGKMIRRYYRLEAVDRVNQTFRITFIFRTYDKEVLISEEITPMKMSYYAYPQLKALFLLAGLEAVEEYGSFEKAPLNNDASDMIFLLRKAAQANALAGKV
jgi:SAM-dependent methyltransferase